MLFNAFAPERDELHVFLPGTDATPRYGYRFMQQSANRGMKTLGLQYVNGPDYSAALCLPTWINNPEPDPDCMEKVANERIYGEDHSPLVSVDPPNSLVNRLAKLLAHLEQTQPELGWGAYLDGDEPDWSRIVLSGHSQGSATTALLARDRELARAILLGGPELLDPELMTAAGLTDPKGDADRASLRIPPCR